MHTQADSGGRWGIVRESTTNFPPGSGDSYTHLCTTAIIFLSKVVRFLYSARHHINSNDHVQCLNRLRRAMYGCTSEAKAHAYRAIVRPCLEYACTVWYPYAVGDIKMLESVQLRSARWIKSFYNPVLQSWTKSSDSCVRDLG